MYNIGDKVIIREDLCSYVNVHGRPIRFAIPSMNIFAGKEATIVACGNYTMPRQVEVGLQYRLSIDADIVGQARYFWTDEMLQPFVTISPEEFYENIMKE